MTTLPDLARSIASQPTDDELEALVATLPPDDLKAFVIGAARVKERAAAAVKMAESRIAAEQVLVEGETYTDETGTGWMWGADRARVCASCGKRTTDGCEHMTALQGVLTQMAPQWGILASKALRDAFRPGETKAYLSALDLVAKFSDDAAAEIRSFIKWQSGKYPHMRKIEP